MADDETTKRRRVSTCPISDADIEERIQMALASDDLDGLRRIEDEIDVRMAKARETGDTDRCYALGNVQTIVTGWITSMSVAAAITAS